jgi:ubiquinone/menaquinone biosynthesis C-methylase UbiE
MILEDNLNKRVNREFHSHTSSDVLSASYRIKNLFQHIWHYPSKKSIIASIEPYLNAVNGKSVLDYGCGRGRSSIDLLSRGAKVCGIDISPVYISEANQAAKQKGYPDNQYSFREMDAHRLKIGDNTFDMVLGEGILHHLNISAALTEIHRVLKTGGRLIMIEPLADNPLLKLFRLLTPFARTADEAPLSKKDLISIVDSNPWNYEFKYCGIIEAPIAMLTSILMPNTPNNWLLKCSDLIEKWIHKHGVLASWNQYVLLNFVKR